MIGCELVKRFVPFIKSKGSRETSTELLCGRRVEDSISLVNILYGYFYFFSADIE